MSGRVLVTGGAGFIGSHIAEAYLAAGWEVVVLDDLSRGRACVDAGGEPVDRRDRPARPRLADGEDGRRRREQVELEILGASLARAGNGVREHGEHAGTVGL